MDIGNSQTQIKAQEEQLQCKICFSSQTPLLKMCSCKGSIGYAHDQCILRWLKFKLEPLQTFEVPYCELCQSKYSVQIKQKSDSFSFSEFKNILSQIQFTQKLILMVMILGLIVLPFSQIVAFKKILYGDQFLVEWFFTFIVFPYYFVKKTYAYFRFLQPKFQGCIVRQVQIDLLPSKIYRG